ncbi:MAG TPA: hydroxyacid dehydrogenase [Burkholderiales bacterium]|nr:hydroxyacid dehydrogenase [Burkholderiales bacterium]
MLAITLRPKFRVGCLGRPLHEAFERTAGADRTLSVHWVPLDQPQDVVAAALEPVHGYYVSSAKDELPAAFRVTPALLARMPQLLVVVTYGAGYDTVDVDACTQAGIAVVNQAGGNAEGVAEHALGMMLALLKRIPEAHMAMKAGGIKRREAFLGRELHGRTVGIVGLGNVGTRTASYLHAFDCRVLAYDPYLDAATCKARGGEKVELAHLLAHADIVSLHCPLTKETRRMFDKRAFDAMLPGAIFLTTARGGVHDEKALHEALASGHLAGAGLDVWDTEPPPPDHPLLAHPAVIASVHTAGVTHESRQRVARMAAEVFIEAAAGRALPRLLNPEVQSRYAARWRAAFSAAA